MQRIRTSWTKRSRGCPDASRRNAAPVGLALPVIRADLLHEVTIDEVGGFIPSAVTGDTNDLNDIDLDLTNGRLRVYCRIDQYGRPQGDRRPPAVRINVGEWLRWQVNYRFGQACLCGNDWSYRLDTVNVALAPAAPDLFLGPPTRHVDERIRLR